MFGQVSTYCLFRISNQTEMNRFNNEENTFESQWTVSLKSLLGSSHGVDLARLHINWLLLFCRYHSMHQDSSQLHFSDALNWFSLWIKILRGRSQTVPLRRKMKTIPVKKVL